MKNVNDKRFEYFNKMCDFDYIIRSYTSPDFNEYVVSRGGDVVTYRVYGTDNFRIGEK